VHALTRRGLLARGSHHTLAPTCVTHSPFCVSQLECLLCRFLPAFAHIHVRLRNRAALVAIAQRIERMLANPLPSSATATL
jgi:hypothetical protein